MASTIICTKERITPLHKNAVLPSNNKDEEFDKYFLKNNEFLESRRRTCKGTVFHVYC